MTTKSKTVRVQVDPVNSELAAGEQLANHMRKELRKINPREDVEL